MHFRRMQMQAVIVDHVDVALEARRDHAAVVEADRQRGLARLHRHHEGDRQFLAAAAVARPVRQKICREAGIADDAAMRAAVGKARHRRRVGQHFPRRVEIAVGIIKERHIEHAAAFIGQHGVVSQLFRLLAERLRPDAERVLLRLLIIRRITEQIDLVVVRLEEQRIVGRARALAQDRRAHFRLAQSRQTLLQRQMRNRLVARVGLEWIAGQFEPKQ
ncbi:hypothetical protein ES703_102192 [subsurface metagenome]